MKRILSLIVLGGIIWTALFSLSVRSASAGDWSVVHFAGSSVQDVWADGSYLYATSTTGQFDVSADTGVTWRSLALPALPTGLAISTQSGADVLAATATGIFVSRNAGLSWTIASGPLVGFAGFRSVARAPSDPNIAWAETRSIGGSSSVVKSTDGGATWSLVTTVNPFFGALIALDPKDPQIVYLTGFGRLYKTTDAGLTWSTTFLGGQIDAIASVAIDPDNPSTVYLSGFPHVVKSTDGGLSFSEFGLGYYTSTSAPKRSGPISIAPQGLYLAGADDGAWQAHGVWQWGSDGWSKVPGLETHTNSVATTAAGVYAATDDGLYRLGFVPPTPSEPLPDPYPVVVIPGIMGSWIDHGVWRLDPITHTYDGLIAALSASGYREGYDLFEFPYQWRASNVDTAELLRVRIAQIKAQTGQAKVNVIAHSMGGLVARQYVEGPHYGDDVNKLILVGVPNLGAPNAYLAWEGEDFSYMNPINAFILKTALSIEMAKAGYFRLYDYIHAKVPSLRELLPIYDYLQNADTGTMRHYPTRYPTNPFLESLDQRRSLLSERGVTVYSIVGDLGEGSTTSGLRVTNESPGFEWPDGYPENHRIPFTDHGQIFLNGDGTVPLNSASIFGASSTLPARHGPLVTASENELLKLLGRPALLKIIEPPGPSYSKALILFVHSPVRISLQRDDQPVEGTFYTGPETEPQVMVVPPLKDGDYRVVAEGLDEGDYQIDLVVYNETSGQGKIAESLQGITRPDQIDQWTIRVTGGEASLVLPASVIHKAEGYPPVLSEPSPQAVAAQALLDQLEPPRSASSGPKWVSDGNEHSDGASAIVAVLALGVITYVCARALGVLRRLLHRN